KSKPLKEINWEEENKKALEQAKKKGLNEKYGINQEYYLNSIAKIENSKKDSQKNIKLIESKEFQDLEIFLDTCDDQGIKPYIILMPTCGKWYDYVGLTKEKRDEFYNKVQEISEKRGFKVLNLKDKEYTNYYMYDHAHFGWEGWLEVDEKLYKEFKDK
ncbi:MAG: D-alanyl-lipoteichoic acid biosynthesis protein DltD, partial [Clostridium sp.]